MIKTCNQDRVYCAVATVCCSDEVWQYTEALLSIMHKPECNRLDLMIPLRRKPARTTSLRRWQSAITFSIIVQHDTAAYGFAVTFGTRHSLLASELS